MPYTWDKALEKIGRKLNNKMDYSDYESSTRNNRVNLNEGWKFKKESDADYIQVDLPHTIDSTGRNNKEIYRGKTEYKKSIFINDFNINEFNYILRFNSVSYKADIYINNTLVKSHEGSFETFEVNITEFIHYGENEIKVAVDNSNTSNDIIPLEADFNFVNGILRDVYIIKRYNIYFDEEIYGSSRVHAEVKSLNSSKAEVSLKTAINNTLRYPVNVKINYTFGSDKSHKKVTLSPGINYINIDIAILNPVMWNGIKSPKLYDIYILLEDCEGKNIDFIKDKTGFRTVSGNKDGFYLNGSLLPLRGVNRHAENKQRSFAITKADHDLDFDNIKEAGFNAIRLAHYPQDRYFIDKCNEYGIIVYIEIPWVNQYPATDTTDNLSNNIRYQFKEMIKEYYNYPCICFWGMHNELTDHKDSEGNYKINYDVCKILSDELYDYAKEKGGNRLIGYARNNNMADNKNFKNDYFAQNVYFGWYYGNSSGMTSWLNANLVRNKLLMFTEYGAGSNPNYHLFDLNKSTWGEDAFSDWQYFHPQEYQCYLHEEYVNFLSNNKCVNSFIWVLNDFAVHTRKEGGVFYQNDKGLITRDRKIKKDVFYLYKAFLNKTKKFTHICAKDINKRKPGSIEIKVYSNCDNVSLYLNNNLLQTISNENAKNNIIFTFKNVPFSENTTIKAVGTSNNFNYSDIFNLKLFPTEAEKIVSLDNSCVNSDGNLVNKIAPYQVFEASGVRDEWGFFKLNSRVDGVERTKDFVRLNNIHLTSLGWSIAFRGNIFKTDSLLRIIGDENETFELYRVSDSENVLYLQYKGNRFTIPMYDTAEHSFIFTFDGKNLRYYLDKQLKSTSDNILDDNKYLANNEIVIGNNNNLNRGMNLKFKKFEIYEGAMSEEQINNFY